MLYLNGHIRVFVNDTLIDNIVSVDVKNDGFHVGASCDIVMPLNARLKYNDSNAALSPNIPDRYQFNTGDHVVIHAKYDGYEGFGKEKDGYLKIFDGFMYDFYETTPIKINCLDYIYWFNQGIYGASYVTTKKLTKTGKIQKGSVKGGEGKKFESIEFADLLQDIVDWVNDESIFPFNQENGTNIPLVTLIRPEFSFKLVKITFQNLSPAAVLEYLKREMGFNITLMDNQLYANVASFIRGEHKLSTDINVIESALQSTNLKKQKTGFNLGTKGVNSVFLRIKLKAYFEKEDGTKDSIEVGDPNGQLREVFFYKVDKGRLTEYPLGSGQMVPENYVRYAQEALTACYMKRYSGGVETYLYPDIQLFDKVSYSDIRYPERNGDYVCTSLEISISDKGYRRKLKLAYLTNYNIYQGANQ